MFDLSLGAPLYPPEYEKVPWYKKPRTIVEVSILVAVCIAGIIVGAVLGSRRSPPPPSKLSNYSFNSYPLL